MITSIEEDAGKIAQEEQSPGTEAEMVVMTLECASRLQSWVPLVWHHTSSGNQLMCGFDGGYVRESLNPIRAVSPRYASAIDHAMQDAEGCRMLHYSNFVLFCLALSAQITCYYISWEDKWLYVSTFSCIHSCCFLCHSSVALVSI